MKNVLICLAVATNLVHSALKTVDEEFQIPKRENRDHPEWTDADHHYLETYNDLDLTTEEFWVDRFWEEKGMVQITDEIFDKYIGNHKEGDKEWVIAIGKTPYQNGKDDYWQSYNRNFGAMQDWMKKALTFKLIYGDRFNVGFIDESTHEHLKETFPHSLRAEGILQNNKMPYCVYIKDGRAFYREPNSINQLGVHSWVIRDYEDSRVISHVPARIHPLMIYWEYIQSGARDMNWWRYAYTYTFNACSLNLEEPYRKQCRDFLKYSFGPLVPNKIVGRNSIIVAVILAAFAFFILRLVVRLFFRHVLLMGDDYDEEIEVTTPQEPAKKSASKPNSGSSRREKID